MTNRLATPERWRLMLLASGVGLLCGCLAAPPGGGAWAEYAVSEHELEPVSPDVDFVGVVDVALADPVLWVLDGAEPFVTRVDLSDPGEVLRFGTEGRGPAELVRPVAIQPHAEGALVWDAAGGRVVVFGHDGSMLRTESLSQDRTGRIRPNLHEITYVDPWRIRVLEDETLYGHFPRGVDRAVDVAAGALVRTTETLERGPTVVDFSDRVPRDASGVGVFAAMPLWDACEDIVMTWDPRARSVIWLDADGAVRASVPLDLGPTELDVRDLEGYVRHVARLELGPAFREAGIDFAQVAERQLEALGTRATTFADLRCAPSGTAWLQLFDMTGDPLGRGKSWLRLGMNGAPELFTFPEAFRPVAFADDGRALGVMDEPLSQTLSLWRISTRNTQ